MNVEQEKAEYKKSKSRSKGKLILKNDDDYKKKKKKAKKAKKRDADGNKINDDGTIEKRGDCASEKIEYHETDEFAEDKAEHGGWWAISKAIEVRDQVAIEFDNHPNCYVHSLDDGSFTLGMRTVGTTPLPQEILTPIPLEGNRFALKTGFGRYVTVEKTGLVQGIAEAYGPAETFEIVFQDGKQALQAIANSEFLSFDQNETLVARGRTAGEEHMLKVRCARDRKADVKKAKLAKLAKEEHGSLGEAERNYSRKFQSWIGGTLRLNAASEKDLKKARDKGTLHSALLQRRSEMKNDKYCK